ncbi:MAG: hypothetical protein AB3N18_00210 [Allomuricauda sp.]
MLKISYNKYLFFLTLLGFQTFISAQEQLNLDYSKIYAHCLDGNVKAALPLLEVPVSSLTEEDQKFKQVFEDRFKGETDNSDYLRDKKTKIHELQLIFRNYWRQYLLDPNPKHERNLGMNAIGFLKTHFPEVKDKNITRDSLGFFLSQYIKSRGFLTTTSVNKTGGLYDLLVWRSQRDTLYAFSLKKEKIKTKVVFMQDFVTLGWEEYATLGKYHPGGWTSNGIIYCVEDAYDLESENFQISYLAHEGRHFLDNAAFPGLDNADLEYRAKLSELSLAKITLYDLVEGFISNANNQSENPHPLANYHVVSNLSRSLFGKKFEEDIHGWKKIPQKKLNKAAYKLLKRNSKVLKEQGVVPESSIRAKSN